APDVPRVREARHLPGVAAIGGLVDPGSPRRALAVVVLAGAHPDDVRVVRRDGDVADRHDVVLIVEEDLPGGAVVRRLPEAAGRGGHVEDRRVALVERDTLSAA